MVAPATSATRSHLARDASLGQINRDGPPEAPVSEDAETHDVVAAEPMEDSVATPAPEAGGRAETPAVEMPKTATRGRPRKVAA